MASHNSKRVPPVCEGKSSGTICVQPSRNNTIIYGNVLPHSKGARLVLFLIEQHRISLNANNLVVNYSDSFFYAHIFKYEMSMIMTLDLDSSFYVVDC